MMTIVGQSVLNEGKDLKQIERKLIEVIQARIEVDKVCNKFERTKQKQGKPRIGAFE
ncbi:hypothetical protein [Paenibacillus endophyticus]|uniref:hypothetical protein n=1 Tax=Paenibacillus endophyticus TaxID=1294268 RepID=UPI0039F12256